jgi:hypothetical protein
LAIARLSRLAEREKPLAIGYDSRSNFDLQMKSSAIVRKCAQFQVPQMPDESMGRMLPRSATPMYVDGSSLLAL